MWLKEENGKLIHPPKNLKTSSGTIMNFNLNHEAMIKYGYHDWTDEEISIYETEHQDSDSCQDLAPTTIQRKQCTKYELITCLQKNFPELLNDLKEIYARSSDFQFYWNSVLNLDRDNADFLAIAQAANITPEQIDSIFEKIS